MQKNTFDKIAALYDSTLASHIRNYYLQKRLRFLSHYIKPKYKVLDLGCGTGILMAHLSKDADIEICGCDNSIEMLKQIKQYRKIPVSCCNSDLISFKDNLFNLVFSVAVFHHLGAKEVVCRTIHEMIRVAKEGGKVIIWDANPLNFYWALLFKKVSYDREVKHLVSLTEIIRVSREAGASAIKVFKNGWIPDFVPKRLMFIFSIFEFIMERMPVIKIFSAHNVIVFTKQRGNVYVE